MSATLTRPCCPAVVAPNWYSCVLELLEEGRAIMFGLSKENANADDAHDIAKLVKRRLLNFMVEVETFLFLSFVSENTKGQPVE